MCHFLRSLEFKLNRTSPASGFKAAGQDVSLGVFQGAGELSSGFRLSPWKRGVRGSRLGLGFGLNRCQPHLFVSS